MSARIIASVLGSAATFIAGIAMPVAYPQAPPWIGQVGLGLSFVLAVAAFAFWWWDRRRGNPLDGVSHIERHIHHLPVNASVGVIPSLELEVIRAPREPLVWISLDEAIRYVAEQSQWAEAQNHDDPNFSIHVGIQLRDALASGDLVARGRRFHTLRGGIQNPPLHPTTPIPRDFWERAIIEAYWPLQRQEQAIAGTRAGSVVRDGANDGWHDVQLERGKVEALWPQSDQSKREPLPQRHTEILRALPPLLATVQEQTLTYGNRDVTAMLAAKSQAEALIAEIPYDAGTVRTVRDFLQACVIAGEPHDTAVAMREARNDVERMAPGLFRQLHAGVSVNRQEVDLPAWTRFGDVGGSNEG